MQPGAGGLCRRPQRQPQLEDRVREGAGCAVFFCERFLFFIFSIFLERFLLFLRCLKGNRKGKYNRLGLKGSQQENYHVLLKGCLLWHAPKKIWTGTQHGFVLSWLPFLSNPKGVSSQMTPIAQGFVGGWGRECLVLTPCCFLHSLFNIISQVPKCIVFLVFVNGTADRFNKLFFPMPSSC